MINVINVALKKTTVVNIDGVEYEMNDAAINLCRKLFTFYVILLGIIVAVSFNCAPLVGSQSLISDVLFVVVCLVIYNGLADLLMSKILRKKVRHE